MICWGGGGGGGAREPSNMLTDAQIYILYHYISG